jgi:hypothetical protein
MAQEKSELRLFLEKKANEHIADAENIRMNNLDGEIGVHLNLHALAAAQLNLREDYFPREEQLQSQLNHFFLNSYADFVNSLFPVGANPSGADKEKLQLLCVNSFIQIFEQVQREYDTEYQYLKDFIYDASAPVEQIVREPTQNMALNVTIQDWRKLHAHRGQSMQESLTVIEEPMLPKKVTCSPDLFQSLLRSIPNVTAENHQKINDFFNKWLDYCWKMVLIPGSKWRVSEELSGAKKLPSTHISGAFNDTHFEHNLSSIAPYFKMSSTNTDIRTTIAELEGNEKKDETSQARFSVISPFIVKDKIGESGFDVLVKGNARVHSITSILKENVDIYKLPPVDLAHQGTKGTQITIGDLHANAMKLMFMLVKHGIATNINEIDYNKLVQIYTTDTKDLTKDVLAEFNKILANIKFNSDSTIRLIGDELADRGNNDYFTLKILEKLNEHKVPVEIIVSNHGIEFIEAYEKQKDFHPCMLSRHDHASSMEKLQFLVEKKIVTREEILKIVNEAYKPTLRAISYSLSEDNKKITIFSHAGIGLNTIKSLAQKLEVNYNDITAVDLAQTIDNINERFQKHVQNNTVNELYTRKNMEYGYSGYVDLSDAPFEFIMWNRLYDHINRPAVHSGYNVNFVHGHDDRDRNKDNICNLDNLLGKLEHMNEGEYTALYSQTAEVALVKKPINIEKISAEQGDVKNQEKPTVIAKSDMQKYFEIQLNQITNKQQDLAKRGHEKAAQCALTLHGELKNNLRKLYSNDINTQVFKKECTAAVNKARPELEKHRGWKQFLGNLALAIAGLGVLYVVAGLIHKATTGNFLFFKTDSASKLDKLDQAIEFIASPKK